ncbi:SPOR domain-containing protein [Planctobacterium marinum]|uniref:SPOR domain-containing protein n=1 Tax=Planctobacterium marinum TaxID=1631968 RepID=UPI001E5E86B6|nr:SPOR domain-containing protein [Planctobacterium marinum]MCC2604781.1 SPOR domain-containing protein [Planctobacterium marinum]
MCAKKDNQNRTKGYLAAVASVCLYITGCSTNGGPNSDAINSQISLQSRSEINKHIQEWEELKPGIKRLVALESDLKFLIAELAKANDISDTPVKQQTESVTAAAISKEPEAPAREKAPVAAASFFIDEPVEQVATPVKKAEVPQRKESKPVSSPFSEDQTDIAQTEPQSEITETATPPPTVSRPQPSRDFVAKSPIFSQSARQSPSIGGPDRCTPPGNRKVEGNVALHLASYSKKGNLQQGWDSLYNKFKDVLCLRSARSELVNVQGKDYYSLRVGPYASQDEAIKDCRILTSKGQYCALSQFSGTRIN